MQKIVLTLRIFFLSILLSTNSVWAGGNTGANIPTASEFTADMISQWTQWMKAAEDASKNQSPSTLSALLESSGGTQSLAMKVFLAPCCSSVFKGPAMQEIQGAGYLAIGCWETEYVAGPPSSGTSAFIGYKPESRMELFAIYSERYGGASGMQNATSKSFGPPGDGSACPGQGEDTGGGGASAGKYKMTVADSVNLSIGLLQGKMEAEIAEITTEMNQPPISGLPQTATESRNLGLRILRANSQGHLKLVKYMFPDAPIWLHLKEIGEQLTNGAFE